MLPLIKVIPSLTTVTMAYSQYNSVFALDTTVDMLPTHFTEKFVPRTCTIPNRSNRTCIQLPATNQKINPEVTTIITSNDTNSKKDLSMLHLQTGWAKMEEVVLLSSVILSKVKGSASQAC